MRRLREFLAVVTDRAGMVMAWSDHDTLDDVQTAVVLELQPRADGQVRIGYVYGQVSVVIPEIRGVNFLPPKTSLLAKPQPESTDAEIVEKKE